jgi:hypothetical protein
MRKFFDWIWPVSRQRFHVLCEKQVKDHYGNVEQVNDLTEYVDERDEALSNACHRLQVQITENHETAVGALIKAQEKIKDIEYNTQNGFQIAQEANSETNKSVDALRQDFQSFLEKFAQYQGHVDERLTAIEKKYRKI